jgi:hypothetical protein
MRVLDPDGREVHSAAVFLAAIIVSPKVVEQRIERGPADNTDRAGGFGSPR